MIFHKMTHFKLLHKNVTLIIILYVKKTCPIINSWPAIGDLWTVIGDIWTVIDHILTININCVPCKLCTLYYNFLLQGEGKEEEGRRRRGGRVNGGWGKRCMENGIKERETE